MQILELATILGTDDLNGREQLRCLSCRRRLVTVHYAANSLQPDVPATLTVTLPAEDLRDCQKSSAGLVLTCSCAARSTFFLL